MRDGSYAWYMMNGFASVTAAFSGVAYFLLLYDLPVRGKPLRFVLTEISVCSFEMYLFSYITDQGVVRLLDYGGVARHSVRLLLLIVGSFIASYAASRILRLISVPAVRWVRGKCHI